MNSIDINNAIYYCKKKCSTINCSECEHIYLSNNCEAYFINDLYDVIDTKTLELNNIKDIIDNTNTKFFDKCLYTTLKSYQFTIIDLFVNDRYKLTKKKDYDKQLKMMCIEDDGD